jgi:hypothetical protein
LVEAGDAHHHHLQESSMKDFDKSQSPPATGEIIIADISGPTAIQTAIPGPRADEQIEVSINANDGASAGLGTT